jgi:hypothetical protein
MTLFNKTSATVESLHKWLQGFEAETKSTLSAAITLDSASKLKASVKPRSSTSSDAC